MSNGDGLLIFFYIFFTPFDDVFFFFPLPSQIAAGLVVNEAVKAIAGEASRHRHYKIQRLPTGKKRNNILQPVRMPPPNPMYRPFFPPPSPLRPPFRSLFRSCVVAGDGFVVSPVTSERFRPSCLANTHSVPSQPITTPGIICPSFPSPRCYVCASNRGVVTVALNTAATTLGTFVDDVLRGALGLQEPTILLGTRLLYECGDDAEGTWRVGGGGGAFVVCFHRPTELPRKCVDSFPPHNEPHPRLARTAQTCRISLGRR